MQRQRNDPRTLFQSIWRGGCLSLARKLGPTTPINPARSSLVDGRTANPLTSRSPLAMHHIPKLVHLGTTRSTPAPTGPYSLVTQQAVGRQGAAGRNSGFGRWRSWALEAYGAAYTLQELLTVNIRRHAGPQRGTQRHRQGKAQFPSRPRPEVVQGADAGSCSPWSRNRLSTTMKAPRWIYAGRQSQGSTPTGPPMSHGVAD